MQILFNARIYTQDSKRPLAQAIALDDYGRILAVGENNPILNLQTSRAQLYNLGGKTIWPGLTDSHQHLKTYALSLQMVNCETGTKAECLRRVSEKASALAEDEWVLGHGWNHNVWPEGIGSAADLDQIPGNRPVYLTSKSLHASWANSRALRLAGIDENTSDPKDGQIGRDVHGHPNGILYEEAVKLVEKIIPKPKETAIASAIKAVQPGLHAMGLTALHDFDELDCFGALQHLHREGDLSLRVMKGIPLKDMPAAINLRMQFGFGDDFLRLGWVKCFADGALGPQTAALQAPYEGSGTHTGVLLKTADEFFEIGVNAVTNGLSLAIHAIGDLANHTVLDAYARLRAYEKSHQLPAGRHRIEHVQLLLPEDLGRLAELGIIAAVQPLHVTSDMYTADRYWGKRARHAYPFHSLLDAGTSLIFGSDAPVETHNPFCGIHAAVTRQRPDGQPSPEGWYPLEKISMAQALHGYTAAPAAASGLGDRLGMLSPGYWGDLIVLEQDPFELHPQDLPAIRPIAVMVAGKWVWQGL